jgi:hypothetical protein
MTREKFGLIRSVIIGNGKNVVLRNIWSGLPTKFYYIKKHEKRGADITLGREKKNTKFWREKLKKCDILKDLAVEGCTITCILINTKKWWFDFDRGNPIYWGGGIPVPLQVYPPQIVIQRNTKWFCWSRLPKICGQKKIYFCSILKIKGQ